MSDWLETLMAPVLAIDPDAFTHVHEGDTSLRDQVTGGTGIFTVTVEWSDGTTSTGEAPTAELAVLDAIEAHDA